MLNLIVSIASDAFQAYCCYLAFKCFFEECKFSKKGEIIAIFFFFLQTTIPHLTINIAGVTTFCSVGACIWFPFIYKGKIKNKLLAGVFVFVLLVLAECLVAALSGYLHLDFLEKEEYFSLYGMVCLPLVEYLVVGVLKNFRNIKKGENVPILYWMISSLLPIFSICLYILFYKQIHWSQVELIVFIIILFLINIFVFFLYDRLIEHFRIRREKESLALQNVYQMKQLELMHKWGATARQQRHDFIKHISAIAQMGQEGRKKEIEEYVAEIKENVQFKQRFVESGNFILDSILNYKIQEVALEGIAVEINVKVPMDIKLSAYDMNSILANLLDNSIEAVRGSDEKKIFVSIEWIKSKLYIQVKNPYTKIIRKEEKFLTTKNDSLNHGLGLKIVEEIVSKYEGTIKISTENDTFCVKICLILG